VSVTFAGFATSFGGLLTARIFIGIFEAGMFPGCLFLIGAWYRRHEIPTRMAWFMVSNDIAGTISGLLGAGLGSLDGIGGYSYLLRRGCHGMLRCRIGLLLPAAVPAPEHLLEAGGEGLAASKARGG
jgi:MFS family permease